MQGELRFYTMRDRSSGRPIFQSAELWPHVLRTIRPDARNVWLPSQVLGHYRRRHKKLEGGLPGVPIGALQEGGA